MDKSITVKELLDKLKEYPKDMEVLLCIGRPYEVSYFNLDHVGIDKTVTDDNTPYLTLYGYDE